MEQNPATRKSGHRHATVSSSTKKKKRGGRQAGRQAEDTLNRSREQRAEQKIDKLRLRRSRCFDSYEQSKEHIVTHTRIEQHGSRFWCTPWFIRFRSRSFLAAIFDRSWPLAACSLPCCDDPELTCGARRAVCLLGRARSIRLPDAATIIAAGRAGHPQRA